MVVVADTSPLNYLILIDADRVLQNLYGEVLVPSAVIRELRHTGAPRQVMQWVADPPDWLRIEDAPAVSDAARRRQDQTLDELGAGEREAILLAQAQTEQVLLLMDEIKGRAEAALRSLGFTGTLGVLDAAAEAGLLDLPSALARLRETSFYVTPALLRRLLDRDAARLQKGKD
jgi:predicted nucleic acid-binding protein